MECHPRKHAVMTLAAFPVNCNGCTNRNRSYRWRSPRRCREKYFCCEAPGVTVPFDDTATWSAADSESGDKRTSQRTDHGSQP